MPIDFAKGQAISIASSKLQKVAGNLPGLLGLNKGKTKLDSSDTVEASQNLYLTAGDFVHMKVTGGYYEYGADSSLFSGYLLG